MYVSSDGGNLSLPLASSKYPAENKVKTGDFHLSDRVSHYVRPPCIIGRLHGFSWQLKLVPLTGTSTAIYTYVVDASSVGQLRACCLLCLTEQVHLCTSLYYRTCTQRLCPLNGFVKPTDHWSRDGTIAFCKTAMLFLIQCGVLTYGMIRSFWHMYGMIQDRGGAKPT